MRISVFKTLTILLLFLSLGGILLVTPPGFVHAQPLPPNDAPGILAAEGANIDTNQLSDLYSNLSGLLAGFMFTAITLFLGNPPKGKEVKQISTPIFMLFLVFFSLIIASFLFAGNSGQASREIGYFQFMLISFIFSTAAVQMFLGIIWFFEVYDVDNRMIEATRWLFQGAVLIAAVHTIYSSSNVFHLLKYKNLDLHLSNPFIRGVTLLLPLFGWFLTQKRGEKAEKWKKWFPSLFNTEKMVFYLIVLSPVVTVIISIYVGFSVVFPVTNASREVLVLIEGALLFLLAVFLFLCELTLPFPGEPSHVNSLLSDEKDYQDKPAKTVDMVKVLEPAPVNVRISRSRPEHMNIVEQPREVNDMDRNVILSSDGSVRPIRMKKRFFKT